MDTGLPKFRLFYRGEMYSFDEFRIKTAQGGWTFVVNEKSVGPSSAALMQFTGLKDSKGVEIYEGDVITVQRPPFGQLTGRVVFKNGSFTVGAEGWYFWDFGEGNDDIIEALGNIHENPELIP